MHDEWQSGERHNLSEGASVDDPSASRTFCRNRVVGS
jgi:hypothetical protein